MTVRSRTGNRVKKADRNKTKVQDPARRDNDLAARLREAEERAARFEEAHETLSAIRSGAVDALVVSGGEGERIYTLSGAERAYRILIEAMGEGALTLTRQGLILYANGRFADLVGLPPEQVAGGSFSRFLSGTDSLILDALLSRASAQTTQSELELLRADGGSAPALVSLTPIPESDPAALCLVVTDLTERKWHENLVASERLASAILERAAEAIVVCDAEGRIIRANAAAHKLCGRNPLLKRFEEVFPLFVSMESRRAGGPGPERALTFWISDLRALGPSGVVRGLEAHLYRDGGTRGLLLSAGPVRVEPGAAAGWVVTLTDITERKRAEEMVRRSHEELEARVRQRTAELEKTARRLKAEVADRRRADGTLRMVNEALRENEKRFRRLFDRSPVGAALVSRDSRYLRVNEALCRITGYSAEELTSMSFADITHPDDLPANLALSRRLRNGEIEQYEMEKRYLRKDGRTVWVHLNVQEIRDEAGELLYFLPIIQNITDRKRADAALQETTRMLEKLVEAAPVGIMVLDPEGRVLLWNPAMEKIYGWTEEEVRGTLPPTVTEEQDGARESLERLLTGERLSGVELRRFRKDGRPIDLLLWTAPFREEDGRLKSTVVILLDVTQVKELERIALSQQKMATLGQVAAGIAHEIRNPLSGINIYLHLLEMLLDEKTMASPEAQKKAEAIVDSMKSASVKMESVISRVLAFSRPGPPRMEPLDINACVGEAMDMVKIPLQKARVRTAVALREDLPACRGDMRLIEQAILNLVNNAAQALEKQEGERIIKVSSSWEDGHVTVSVADSGPGIPEAIRERIFEPFFTTKGLGNGIGLSITQRIVADHGGFIRVGRSRWGGALFTIGLPTGHERELPAA